MPLTTPTKYLIQVIVLFLVYFANLAYAQSERFDDPVVLQHGKQLFKKNCSVCHGQNAEGTVADWQKPDENGKYPPPPLNGTAHTWHHPINALGHTIRNGTIGIGGSMPAWREELSDDEIFSIIMWLSSLWPDEIYNAWMERNSN